MWKATHQFLKWLPTATAGAVLAISGIYSDFKDKVGGLATEAWSAMNDTQTAALVVCGVAAYLILLVWTGVMAARSDQSPKFLGSVDSMTHGGVNPSDPSRRLLCFNCTIRNVGNMASVALHTGWDVKLKTKGGVQKLNIWLTTGTSQLQANNGLVELREEDALVRALASPLNVGDHKQGYIFCLVDENTYSETLDGATVHFTLTDIFDKKWTFKHYWKPSNDATIPYIPFANKQ